MSATCPASSATAAISFVSAVNAELRAQAYRKQLRIGLTENRSVAWGQYMDMADVLSRVADELGSLNGSDPLAERRLIRYLRSMDIDADASVYRDGGGRLHVTIESGRLTPLLREENYLEKLSAVVGARLCRSGSGGGVLKARAARSGAPCRVRRHRGHEEKGREGQRR